MRDEERLEFFMDLYNITLSPEGDRYIIYYKDICNPKETKTIEGASTIEETNTIILKHFNNLGMNLLGEIYRYIAGNPPTE